MQSCDKYLWYREVQGGFNSPPRDAFLSDSCSIRPWKGYPVRWENAVGIYTLVYIYMNICIFIHVYKYNIYMHLYIFTLYAIVQHIHFYTCSFVHFSLVHLYTLVVVVELLSSQLWSNRPALMRMATEGFSRSQRSSVQRGGVCVS